MTPERAEILALEGLGWLAGQPDDLQRFLNLSGMDVAALRAGAGSSEMSAALLDFLLGDEPLLLRFCEDSAIDPRQIQFARNALGAA
jgi:Protein of unknown function (DUF3572)